MKILYYYLILINAVSFMTFGIDKYKAKRNRFRIPEATLLGLCAVGGSIGGFLGMQIFHHKTRKNKFRIGVPLILLIQILLICFIIMKFFKIL